MAAGRPPFRANSTLAVLKRVAEDTPRPIREIIPEAPQWLCDIIAKLHAKNPDDRFQSAREVADVLADCEAQLKAHGEMRNFARIPGGGKSPVKSKYRRLAMGLCGVAALFGAAMLFGEPAYRYAVNRAAIEVVPESGLTSISIHRDGQAVTDWYDAKTADDYSPPGEIQTRTPLRPGPDGGAMGTQDPQHVLEPDGMARRPGAGVRSRPRGKSHRPGDDAGRACPIPDSPDRLRRFRAPIQRQRPDRVEA